MEIKKFTYDREIDAAYFSFNENTVHQLTKEYSNTIFVDFNTDDEITGVEILDYSTIVDTQVIMQDIFMKYSSL